MTIDNTPPPTTTLELVTRWITENNIDVDKRDYLFMVIPPSVKHPHKIPKSLKENWDIQIKANTLTLLKKKKNEI